MAARDRGGFDVTLQGKRQLQARLTAIGKTEVLMQSIVIHGVREAKLLYTRQSKKTGNLGRTIRVGRVSATRGELIAGGRFSVGYAAAVERGTGPHVIRPRNKRALAWGGSRRLSGQLRSGARATHFATVVHHPGTKAKPYLVPGLQKSAKDQGLDTIVSQWNKSA